MIDPEVVDNALAIAGRQLVLMVGNLEDGLQPMPTLWAFDGSKVKITYLECDDSEAAQRMARHAVNTELSGCESASLVTDVFVTDPRTRRQLDALLVTVLKAGTELTISYALPYERGDDGLTFPAGLQLLESDGLPDDYANTRLQDAVLRGVSGPAPIRARIPAEVSTAFRDTAPSEEMKVAATEVRLVGEAPLAVFALVAAADGSVDEKEVRAFLKGLGEHLGATRVLGTATEIVLRAGGAGLLREVIERGPDLNLLHLAAVSRSLDGMLGQGAPAEKRALLDLGTSIASASGSWWRRIGPEERRTLDNIAAMLRLA